MAGNSRHTRNALVLSMLDKLGSVFPESRNHQSILKEAGSDFTYAAPAPSETSFAGCWLAMVRLSPELEERLGIHQEIPVVYSPHADVQGRAIVRLKDLLAALPKERQGYAGGVVFFWAPDPRLETKLERFSKTELVLLPLPTGGVEAFLSALTSRLYSQDLYRERTYVTGDQFFGRRAFLAQLRGDLDNRKVPAVFGTRKTGKTSILKELVRTSAADGHTDLKEVFVYADLEHLPRPSGGVDPIPELLGDLADEIRKELKGRGLRTKELGELGRMPSLLEFRRALTAILGHPTNVELYLVIILDEIEHLAPPNADDVAPGAGNESIPQFFGVLRKLVQELENFNFVVAGLASAIVESGELYGRHNPLFRLAAPYYLKPFTESEAAELLQGIGSRLGILWLPDAITAAHEESGGQVVLLRELAAQVWDSRRTNSIDHISVGAVDVERAVPAYRRAVRDQIEETIEHVKRYYPDASDLCNELVVNPVEFRELADAYPGEMNRLSNLGLIQEEDGLWMPTQLLRLGWVSTNVNAALPRSSQVRPISELVKRGEGRYVEFKASIRTPLLNQVAEIVVIEAAVKAVLAFLNADGGTLLAGVSDDGTVVGLDQDIKRTGHSKDAYVRWLTEKLNSYLGQSITSSITMEWHGIEGCDVLLVDVPRAADPVFPARKIEGKEGQLFVRQNANVISMTGPELLKYNAQRFSG